VRYAVNCSILLTGRPLLERPAAARAAGFDAVEFWWPFEASVPPDADVERFASAIEDAGVRLVSLNLAGGSLADGERGLVSTPGRSAEFRDSVDVAAGLGERLGIEIHNALYGNRIAGVDPAEQGALAVENLAHAVARLPGTVVLEPLSGAPDYPLRTVADAVAACVPGVHVLADLYHLAVNGDDIPAAIAEHADRIAHVQIADAPGRHEPGSGTLAIDGHLAALAAAGYRGFVSLEYVASTADPFAWLHR
jgi:hydroxypyruvate isomerase